MDIRKLQRVIVDGLEDVKGQNIVVFNTEHLSSLFERVIIASGTSNRQTKSLATSVREAVKDAGFPIPRTEGESNGEWIIVDCGAAVVHVMQPTIRDFYRLEEIWGDKPVRMKIDSTEPRLVKASEPEAPAKRVTAKRAAPRTPSQVAWTTPPAKQATARKVAAKKVVAMPGAPVKKAAAKKTAPQRLVTRVVGLKKPAPGRAAVKQAPAKKAAVRRAPVKKAAARA